MKKKKPIRDEVLQIRVTEFEKNRIEGLAKIYAGGNTSLYVIYHALNAPRVFIKPEDRTKRRGRS